MKLWLVSQDENNGYDTFDAFVCAAETEDAARVTLPRWSDFSAPPNAWASSPEKVYVVLLGDAVPGTAAGLILESFNAG